MKKNLLLLLSLVLVLVLAACGGKSEEDNAQENKKDNAEDVQEEVTLKIGASSTPHAEILEEAIPLLEEEGITLEIEEYVDFILPNDDVANGPLDGNFFQHIPHLEQAIGDTGYELSNIGAIHVEPMGVYSQTIKDVDSISDGTEVILSNSVSDHGRVLALFQSAGLITLDDSVDVAAVTIKDIVENPKNLKFSPDYEAAFLPELYNTEPDTLVAINTNYAIDADLNPLKDALFIEGNDSPYLNIIVARTEDKDNEALKTLVNVLLSDEIQEFILENFDGAVIPVK